MSSLASGNSADRNLLFGILAVQMDFVSRDALIAAMNARVLAKRRPLGWVRPTGGARSAAGSAFPIRGTSPVQSTWGGGTSATYQYEQMSGTHPIDAFVAKFAPSGTTVIYSTCPGGSGNDQGNSIAVDSSGNAYIAGTTTSSDLPTQSAASITS
jgi:hypothetical protein